MKRWLTCLLVVPLSWAPVLPAQQKPAVRELPVDITAEELRARVEAAIGGAEAWKRVVSTVSRGVVEIEGVGKGKFEEYRRSPNLAFTRIVMDAGEESLEGCDGKIAWEKDSEGARALEGTLLREALYDCDFLHPFALGRSYKQLKIVGKAAQQEQEFYLVDAFRAGGEKEVLTILAGSYLPQLLVVQRQMEGQTITIPVVMSDYRSIGGLKLPHLLVSKLGGTKLTLRFDSIDANAPFDDAIFRLPK